jgi:hypothetical protein
MSYSTVREITHSVDLLFLQIAASLEAQQERDVMNAL